MVKSMCHSTENLSLVPTPGSSNASAPQRYLHSHAHALTRRHIFKCFYFFLFFGDLIMLLEHQLQRCDNVMLKHQNIIHLKPSVTGSLENPTNSGMTPNSSLQESGQSP